MEDYPADYVQHNLPLIVLSGLGAAKELDPPVPVQQVLPGRAVTRINSDIPPVTGQLAEDLLRAFVEADGTNAPWNGRAFTGKAVQYGFRLRSIGRSFQLPPKKADAPTTSVTTPPSSPTIAAATSWTLHSPISPLSPASPVFPDGLTAPAWVAKHQHYVPSVFISFFDFVTDPITNSLHDNQLKTEINKIKAQIQKSEYRTRYVVVLLSDKTVLEAPDIEERLANIRRTTGLDPKSSLFFVPPNISAVEIRAFVASVLSNLHSICVEYYRDLTKHARRKKGRGTIPPPTAPPTRGTSQTLSYPGWGVRYDFKLGVFAEFRQEMDAAQRHYNIALEALFGPEGIFETTASWSPRWDEIRLLADVIVLRHIRCQLWNGCPTSAAQMWLKYKLRLRDILDRRGKGTANYGWQAWESRWALSMAQMIQRTELPVFKIRELTANADVLHEAYNSVFSLPEKQFPIGERLPPWELLHHAGYWQKLSADHSKKRYILTREMPEEDRTPPGMSPATKVSNRNQMYDSYLVPQPHEELPLPGIDGGFEHCNDICRKLKVAISEFEARGQPRKVEQLQLELAKTLLHQKQFDEAFKVLQPLCEKMTWRKEGWWSLASEVLWALHECALRVRNPKTYLATEWELYNQVLPGRTRYQHNLMSCLDAFPEPLNGKISVEVDAEETTSCLSIHFAFSALEGNVGEPLSSQIFISSNARSGSAPIVLNEVTLQFSGGLREVKIMHDAEIDSSNENSSHASLTLEEKTLPGQKPHWTGHSDLEIQPGESKVYDFYLIFREAGDIDLTKSSLSVSTEKFELVSSKSEFNDEHQQSTWWIKTTAGVKPRKLKGAFGTSIHILPKPPKMEIQLPGVRNQYFTDEAIVLSIELINHEEEETEAVLEVRLLGRSKDALAYSWVDRPVTSPMKEVPPPLGESNDVDLPGHVVGRLAPNERTTENIRFVAPADPADYALEVKVLYHVLSEREIPISKILVADLVFNAPFEASYDLNARVHSDLWPSYFELQGAESNMNPDSTDAFGIAQRWGLRAKVASFADEDILVKDVNVHVHGVHGGAACDVLQEFDAAEVTLSPQVLTEWSFGLDVRKNSLEERRSTALDTTLDITWQRTSTPNIAAITSSLPIPRIQIPSSEPRILASVERSTTVESLVHLDYTLENPTMHFLTFELNMEASEEFGFSGVKLRTLHLLPMSRQAVRYSLYPLVQGAWISPSLKVTDRYFNKTLKVQATEGLKMDKKGISVWIPGGKGQDEALH